MPFSKLAITIILALFLFIGCKEKPKAVEKIKMKVARTQKS